MDIHQKSMWYRKCFHLHALHHNCVVASLTLDLVHILLYRDSGLKFTSATKTCSVGHNETAALCENLHSLTNIENANSY